MPIKDVDLKTFDAYKLAIRKDVTRITNTSKVKFWLYKDIELPDLKGKKQKILTFLVLVEDNGARAFLRGKKLVCLGTCRLEEGKVHFEPVKGKIPYSKLKPAVPVFLGKQLYIPTAAPEEDEDDGEIADEGADEPHGQPPSSSSDLAAAWTRLQAEMQAAIAAVPARREPVLRAAAGIAELVHANDVQAAAQKMDAVRALLNAPPPPPPPPSGLAAAWQKLFKEAQAAIAANPARREAIVKAAAGIPDLIKTNAAEAEKRMSALEALLAAPLAGHADAAALKAAWDALAVKIKAAGNAELTHAAADAGKRIAELVHHGDVAAAQAVLAQLATQLERLKPAESAKLTPAEVAGAWQKLVPTMEQQSKLHPEVKDAAMRARRQVEELVKAGKLSAAKQAIDDLAALLANASEPKGQPAEDPQKSEFERRRAQMDPDILRALRENIGDASGIRSAVALADERAEAGDYASALKILARVSTMLMESKADEREMPVAGLVEYRKKLAAFDSALRKVEQESKALTAAILENLPEDRDVAEELSEALGNQTEEIQDLIDAAVNAANDEKAPADAALKAQIQSTIKKLESSAVFELAEGNPFGVTVDIRKPLSAALKQILEAIPAVV